MSFDSVALTGKGAMASSTPSDPVQIVSKNISTISSNVSQLEKLSKLIGTTKDSQEIRQQIASLIDSTRNLAKQTAEDLRSISTDSGDWDDRNKGRIVQQKLMKELQSFLQKFQELTKFTAKQERAFPAPAPKQDKQQPLIPGLGSSRGEFSINISPEDQERQQREIAERNRSFQMQSEVEFTSSMIQDREKGIKEIEKTMQEVNEIFIDLSNLVVEQGQMIDNIESNIESGLDHTNKGYVEVQKASEYQKSSRNKMCCLALILMIVLAVIIGAVFLFLKK
jgi:syntaxin 7